MDPLESLFASPSVFWTENQIVEQDAIVSVVTQIVRSAWKNTNKAIRFWRVETPILTPTCELESHMSAGFSMLQTSRGTLRPETTAGCVAAFRHALPTVSQRRKSLPFCVWQIGKSFRDEGHSQTMRVGTLRLVEFTQLEFQLFASIGTMAPYTRIALQALVDRFGGAIVATQDGDLPHYAASTLDWEIGGVEISSASVRTDMAPECEIHEVSIGIERLCTAVTLGQEEVV